MEWINKFYVLLCLCWFQYEFNLCSAQSCEENDVECHGSLQVPLLSQYSAPLKADLDLSELTKQMTKLIKSEIKRSVASILPGIVDSVIADKLYALESKFREVNNSAGVLQNKYENVMSRLETLDNKIDIALNVTNILQEGIKNGTKKADIIENAIAEMKCGDEEEPDDVTTIDVYDIAISIELEISLPSIYNSAILYSVAFNSQKSIACYPTVIGSIMKRTSRINKIYSTNGRSAKDYVTIFTEPYSRQLTIPTLYIYSRSNGTAMIKFEGTSNKFHITRGANEKKMPKSVFLDNHGVSNKVIRITSDIPIEVFGFQRHKDTCDGYLAIPEHYLSRNYVVPSFTVWGNRKLSASLIGIASLSKRTKVEVHVKTSSGLVSYEGQQYGSGKTITITLESFQSVQLTHTYDLTGSIVSASEPIAVVSGNKCNSVTVSTCNHFTEYVIPAEKLDKEFVIPPILKKANSTVRLLTYENSSIFISGKEEKHITLEKAQYHDIEHMDISYIKSTTGLLVTIFPHEKGSNVGDSFMMTIHGVNQYKSRYDFIVPEGFSSSISIAIQGGCGMCKSFVLDEEEISFSHSKTKSINGTAHSALAHNINHGPHTLFHKYEKKFGLWLYGFRNVDGYGYPAGMSFH